MKKNWITFIVIPFVIILLFFLNNCDSTRSIKTGSKHTEISFDINTGALLAFRDLTDSIAFLQEALPSFSPWEIEIADTGGVKTIDIFNASRFRHWKPNDTTLILEWDRFKKKMPDNFAVSVIIILENTKPMTSWRISLGGTNGIQVSKVAFPRIKITRTEGDEYLAVPEWMGQLIKGPREHLASMKSVIKKYEWSYPGPLSMQCAALYTPGKRGFYAACNDTLAFRKNFAFTLDSSGNLIYQLNSFPAIDTGSDKYEPSYSSVIGSFNGDWITAAEIYRDWGSKQKWSRKVVSKQDRLRNGLKRQLCGFGTVVNLQMSSSRHLIFRKGLICPSVSSGTGGMVVLTMMVSRSIFHPGREKNHLFQLCQQQTKKK